MTEQNLVNEPQEVYNLKGDAARIAFVKNFKEIQKLKTQLNQYTDLEEEQKKVIETILPTETLHGFRSSYLETAKQLKMIQDKQGDDAPIEIQELDFEFILFASSVIDYDYIMNLISDSTQQKTTKQKMSKEQVKNLLKSTSNLMDEEQDLSDFIDNLDWTKGYGKEELTQLFDAFKNQK